MKKSLFFVIAALVTLTVASCIKEEALLNPENCKNQITVAFDNASTKTTLTEEGKTVWAEGDQVWVSNGTASETITVPAEAVGQKKAVLPTTLNGTLYLVYPAKAAAGVVDGKVNINIPAVQDGSFASANICTGVTSDYNASLKNSTAVIKLTVEDGTVAVLADAGDVAISGTYSVDLASGTPVLTAGTTDTHVTVENAESGAKTCYVAVAPGTYKSGFYVAAITSGLGAYYKYTAKASNTLAVNDLVDLGNVALNDEYAVTLLGDGSADAPYTIKTLADWMYFAYDVSSGNDYAGMHVKVSRDISGISVPAGTCVGSDDFYFKGELDGNGKTMTLNMDGGDYMALIGDAGEGVNIHDIKIAGTVKGASSTAALIGCLNAGAKATIKNVTTSATVSGTTQVGGIVGYADATVANGLVIEDCANTGDITGSTFRVGGIVGYFGADKVKKVTNCTNSGNVTGASNVGGIVGYSFHGVASGCTNSGTVKGTSTTATSLWALVSNTFKQPDNNWTNAVGGVYGYAQNGSISNCNNSGDVSAVNKVGGIAGQTYWCPVSGSTNTGNIEGRGEYQYNWASQAGMNYGSSAGGIVGWINGSGNVSNCTNEGKVTGKGGNAGIVGTAQASSASSTFPVIQNCVNKGEIVGTPTAGGSVYVNAAVGGIVGLTWSQGNRYVRVLNCRNDGPVTCKGRKAGGIVGQAYEANNASNGLVEFCVNNGPVTATYYAGGIVGMVFARSGTYGLVFRNVENNGTITGNRSDDGGECTGGIAGIFANGKTSLIYNAVNNGDVLYAVASHVKPYTGGIIGRNVQSANLINVVNNGFVGPVGKGEPAVGAEARLGALIGSHELGTLKNSYYLSGTCTQEVGTASAVKAGANVTSFTAAGKLEGDVEIDGVPYEDVVDALNAWVLAQTGTYYTWGAGPVLVRE